MRRTPFIVTALLLAAFLPGLGACMARSSAMDEAQSSQDQAQDRANANSKAESDSSSFAVVELFTSEGCSSCPPADKVLNKLNDKAERQNTRVYPLAFHVTYWDNLGWTDPFGDKAYTNRQRRYARAFNSNRVYTPQMVVNGQAEFVGSNAAKAERNIAHALDSKPDVDLSIERASVKTTKRRRKTLTVAYKLTQASPSQRLNIAVTEDKLASEIRRGENAGRKLNYDAVVRGFKQITPKTKGKTTLTIPREVDLDHAAVILYLQDARSMTVQAATAAELSSGQGQVQVQVQGGRRNTES